MRNETTKFRERIKFKMAYRFLADLVLILHLCFVVFVVLGGLLVLRRRSVAWLHIPALIWGVLVEVFLWACPLTTIENSLRQLGGEAGYEGGFIDHYISMLLYADISPQFRIALGFALLGINLIVYGYLLRRDYFVPKEFNRY
jgi:hypothetical protein